MPLQGFATLSLTKGELSQHVRSAATAVYRFRSALLVWQWFVRGDGILYEVQIF